MSSSQEDAWGTFSYQRIHPISGPPSATIVQSGHSLSSLSHPEAYILELGCGTGVMTQILSAEFPTAKVLAADLSAGMLAQVDALKLPNVTTRKLDAADLSSVEGEDFTHIFSSATIQFCEDPKQPVREAYRVLKGSRERRRERNAGASEGVVAIGTWTRIDLEELNRAMYSELGIEEKMVSPFDAEKWPRDEDGVRREFEKVGFRNVQTKTEWMSDGKPLDEMLEHLLVWKNPGAMAMRQAAIDRFGLEKCTETARRVLEQGARGEGRFGKSAEAIGVGQVIGIGTV